MLSLLKSIIPRSAKLVTKRILKNLKESICYRFSRQHFVGDLRDAKHVIFICKGNICRSAFAEKYLAQKCGKTVTIESCGLDVDQGGVSPREAIGVAGEFGVDLESHWAKGVLACDFAAADLIVVMEYWQYKRLIRIYPGKASCTFLLRDFCELPDRLLCNIHDPFGHGDKAFRSCYRQMVTALDRLNEQMTASRG